MGQSAVGSDLLEALLPMPRRITRRPGACGLHGRPLAARFDFDDSRLESHWIDLHRRIEAARSAQPAPAAGSEILEFIFAADAGAISHPDGYRLDISPDDRIALIGGSPAGCFYALQTLLQLLDAAPGGVIPCCTIEDAPDLKLRGLLHDVTRGKTPTLATLKGLVDRLARLKINQLQLYIEHAFVFDFDRDICDADHGLTPDEVAELARYCRTRFIDLVPAVATMGHMGRILSMPRHAHLAEIPAELPWEKMSWLQRLRGLTLDVLSGESLVLVREIWTDVLNAFAPPAANICGDEPHDLGRGRNAGKLSGDDLGRAYVDRVAATADIVRRRGARPQFWSDVVTRHPKALERLPRDVAVLHWGYDDRADTEGTRRFVEAGLETIVCPGTTGWKRIINALDLAERNIAAFSEAASRCRAVGLLNTDWGDCGHFNALGCSWHGIALGAARAWRTDHPIGVEFDRRFMQCVICGTGHWPVNLCGTGHWPENSCGTGHWPVRDTGFQLAKIPTSPFIPDPAPSLLRRASRLAESCETWRLFCQDYDTWAADALPSDAAIDDAQDAAGALVPWCDAAAVALPPDDSRCLDLTDWRLAAELTITLCDRLRARTRRLPDPLRDPDAQRRLADWTTRYAAHWLTRNKPSDLDHLLAALNTGARHPIIV